MKKSLDMVDVMALLLASRNPVNGTWTKVSECKRCGLKLGYWKLRMYPLGPSPKEDGRRFRCKRCGGWRERRVILVPQGTLLVTEELPDYSPSGV